MPTHVDVLVIGTGPGGEGAAMQCSKGGLSVAVVDKRDRVGGSCTHKGTIPSKALRHAVGQLMAFRNSTLFGPTAHRVDVTFPKLLASANTVIDKQVRMRRDFYTRNHVEVFHGEARFTGPNDVDVISADGHRAQVHADHIVIATGARPYHPPHIHIEHPRVHDSDSILGLRETPRSVVIYGAGVIGCEYASIFKNMGVKVQLVNNRGELLSFLDDEIIDALSYHLRDRGVTIRHSEVIKKVTPHDDHVVIDLESGKSIKAAILLWAQGRTGNTDALNLSAAGLAPDSRGRVEVDARFQTKVKHIYGVGDVIGPPGLASASYDQGRFAAGTIVGTTTGQLVEHIPTGIYTDPEISSIGRTERELTEAGVPYEVGRSLFRHLARAQITGQRVGMLKLLFHRETLELLGIHCFGDQASEIVHIGQAILSQKGEANTMKYFTETTFNYPTMAEAYRVAALNGLNRLC